MRYRRRFLKFLISIILLLGNVGLRAGERIVSKGSDTLGAKLMPRLCEAYKALHPAISFEITAEGSSTAIPLLLDGMADIGMSYRGVNEQELAACKKRGIELQRWLVAHDSMVILVHKSNPVTGLTRRQVEAIFTGDTTNWREVGGGDQAIKVVTRNTSSGTYRTFREVAMRGREYGAKAQKMAGGETVPAIVAKDESAIGYFSLAYTRQAGIVLVKIDGASPSDARDYPFTTPCYCFAIRPPRAVVQQFLEWVTQSVEARKIVSECGLIPPLVGADPPNQAK